MADVVGNLSEAQADPEKSDWPCDEMPAVARRYATYFAKAARLAVTELMAEGATKADRLNQTLSSSADYEMSLKPWNQGGLDLFAAALDRDELKRGSSDVSP
eukprot:7609206-Alexandrium_andersonii.AAC.1